MCGSPQIWQSTCLVHAYRPTCWFHWLAVMCPDFSHLWVISFKDLLVSVCLTFRRFVHKRWGTSILVPRYLVWARIAVRASPEWCIYVLAILHRQDIDVCVRSLSHVCWTIVHIRADMETPYARQLLRPHTLHLCRFPSHRFSLFNSVSPPCFTTEPLPSRFGSLVVRMKGTCGLGRHHVVVPSTSPLTPPSARHIYCKFTRLSPSHVFAWMIGYKPLFHRTSFFDQPPGRQHPLHPPRLGSVGAYLICQGFPRLLLHSRRARLQTSLQRLSPLPVRPLFFASLSGVTSVPLRVIHPSG